MALYSDPGSLGGGREGAGCSKRSRPCEFPVVLSVPPSLSLNPPCSAAQSITNAKLGAWGGMPPQAMAMAWSVPRDSAWTSWIIPPNAHVLQEERPPSAILLAALGSPTPRCYAHRKSSSGGPAPTYIGRAFLISHPLPKITSSPPPSTYTYTHTHTHALL